MQRSAFWIGPANIRAAAAVSMLGFAVIACSDEGVGDPCTPEAIPVKNGMFGFERTEAYIEASSVQCRSRLCIVNKLDNGNPTVPADPRNVCDPQNPKLGCVDELELKNSVYCTCKCGGPETREHCDCPDPFKCEPVLTLGGAGIRGSYCVRPKAAAQ